MFLVEGIARFASLINLVERLKRFECEYQICDSWTSIKLNMRQFCSQVGYLPSCTAISFINIVACKYDVTQLQARGVVAI